MGEAEQDQEEIDPFVKRVVTVKSGDVVIFKYAGDPEDFSIIKTVLDEKMGDIPYVLVGPDFDVTVLKRSENKKPGIWVA